MSAVTASELAMHLNLSKTTLTRAIASLKQLSLISIKEVGTKKFLAPAIASKHAFLDAAKPYLQSPVHQTIYLSEKLKKGLLGGILALSDLTMLSATKRDGCYVVSRNQAKELESDKISKQDFLDFGGFPVEIWKYGPALFASGRIVDNISLIVSFTQQLDERTEQALESVKKRVSW